MEADLKNLRIERTDQQGSRSSAKIARWIAGGVGLLGILAGVWFLGSRAFAASEVEVRRVTAVSSGGPKGSEVALNATGYVVAAHRIEVAAKVVGKVSWIGAPIAMVVLSATAYLAVRSRDKTCDSPDFNAESA